MHERLGKFQIVRLLGKGAMGEVYLGRDTVLGRDVAIKTIMAGSAFGEEARQRFEREARVTGTLNHPHIVTVYEFGQAEDVHFLVMEYVEGDTLEGIIQKRSLSRGDLMEVLAQVCDGLAYAHDHGVIHRDIKPANVLVAARGKRLQAKLMDFGVATVDRSNLTQQGIWMGTVNYMAPEYLDTGKASPSSDLFAVGVILYEMLSAGRKPFEGETTTTILNAILRGNPAPFSPDEIRGVHPQVLALVRRALAKAPQDRYESADALAQAIRDAARAVEPVAAPAPPPRTPAKDPSDRILIVGRGGKAHCLSLRVALRQAGPGCTIIVQPGHYREALILDRPITIRGDGDVGEIVLETPRGTTISVQAPEVVLENLTLAAEASTGEPLLDLSEGQITLAGCHLRAGGGPALRLHGRQASAQVDQCHLSGSGDLGLVVADGATLTLQRSKVQGFDRAAVQVESGASATVHQCQVEAGLGVGIWVRGTGRASLEDTEVLDREAGSLEAEGEARIEARHGRLQGSRFAGVLATGKAQIALEDVEVSGHGASGCHLEEGASLAGRQLKVLRNGGYGFTLLSGATVSLEASEISRNGAPGVLIHRGATAQMKACKLFDGLALGVVCSSGGRGVLEACEIYGNAQSGAQVEPGGSLLLVKCVLRDGRDTGLLLFEDAEATLEECVVHRNARGGILLSKDASDPVIRGASGIDDDLFRSTPQGGLVKLAPVKKH
jgi:predicted Ser/Thr protein kinase